MKARVSLTLSGALLVLAPFHSEAQQSTGTIIGVVQDSTGAVIPNASVSLSHPATGGVRVVKTNERGEFTSAFMRIGEYTVTAEAPGFKKRVASGIVLQVDQAAMVTLDLEVGQVTESVEVSAAAPLLDTATSSLGQVIENRKILDLPLNGRNTFALGLLAGNTIPIAGMGTNLPFVAGGGRYASNDVLLDGIDNNTSINAGSIGRNGIAYTPSVDAVEEFKVKTNNFSAEFGRSAGAIISASLKSGTNDLRGNAWEFVRNEKFEANNFFSNANRLPHQPFKQNQYGFTLGGPVYVPKFYNGKNRTFFFFDYEATGRRTSASSSTLDIPPMSFRTGDFSSYAPRIYDPSARRIGPSGTVISTPFPGNAIPQNQLNKSSLAIVGLLPPPNAGAPGATARNYVRIAPRPFDQSAGPGERSIDVPSGQRRGRMVQSGGVHGTGAGAECERESDYTVRQRSPPSRTRSRLIQHGFLAVQDLRDQRGGCGRSSARRPST